MNLNKTYFSRFYTHTMQSRLQSMLVYDLMDEFENGLDELDRLAGDLADDKKDNFRIWTITELHEFLTAASHLLFKSGDL